MVPRCTCTACEGALVDLQQSDLMGRCGFSLLKLSCVPQR